MSRVEVHYTHKKRAAGGDEFARVKIVFEPGEKGGGVQFESLVADGQLPSRFIAGAEKAVRMLRGSSKLLAGTAFAIIEMKATLIEAECGDPLVSTLPLDLACREATQEAMKKGAFALFEPIMDVTVETPEAYVGSVVSDLRTRGGHIRERVPRAGVVTVHAQAPMANMLGYAEHLSALSQGCAANAVMLSHFAPSTPPEDGTFRPAMAMRA